MNSPKKPNETLRKQAIKKILAMPPKQRERLMKLEALRRGIDLPVKKA